VLLKCFWEERGKGLWKKAWNLWIRNTHITKPKTWKIIESPFRNDKEQCVDKNKNKQNYELEICLSVPLRLGRVQKSLCKVCKEQGNKNYSNNYNRNVDILWDFQKDK